jgi:cytochrome d ubiquinol oxidase subunit II
MATLWFCFLAVMVTIYVVLDGFDLGVGTLHLLVARTEEEREQTTAAIGPVWNGNEVWLIASGGVLFLAFPAAYAAAFSGLYFGLIIVLWLLVGRGLALELRHQLDNPLWRSACDTIFALSSAGLALVFGVALGNVVRGVPLTRSGYFSLPLFDTLNWYALLIGVFGLVVLAAHGSMFLALRGTGAVQERAGLWARRLWVGEALLFVALAGPTYAVRDELLALAALVAILVFQRRALWGRAFAASSLFIAGLLTTMAAGLYPNVLPAHDGRPYGLTVDTAASGHTSLTTALFWWPVGMALAAVYFVYAYRLFFRAPREPTIETH